MGQVAGGLHLFLRAVLAHLGRCFYSSTLSASKHAFKAFPRIGSLIEPVSNVGSPVEHTRFFMVIHIQMNVERMKKKLGILLSREVTMPRRVVESLELGPCSLAVGSSLLLSFMRREL